MPGETKAVPGKRMLRIVIADDHDLTRKGLRSLIDDQRDLHLVGEARNGQEALALCCELQPDMAILDVRMPELDGLAATRAIKHAFPRIAVLLVSLHAAPEYILEALEAGASGYVLKAAPLSELLVAIRDILGGNSVLSEALAARMIQRAGQTAPRDQSLRHAALTPREHEVLRLIGQGLSNRAIAARLTIAAGTVKLHVEHIIAKLGVSDRTQAAVRAIQLGLVAGDA